MRGIIYIIAIMLLCACGAMQPVGDAGEDQEITLGETATLSGVDSNKKNGDNLRYEWSIVSAPTGSQAELSDPSAAEPTFTPDKTGEYTFQLIVDNDYHDSEPVTVNLTVKNAPPPPPPAPHEPQVFTSNEAGTVTAYDFAMEETFRDDTDVEFNLILDLENTGRIRANCSFFVYGLNADGLEVFAHEIKKALNPFESTTVNVNGLILPKNDFDSIAVWEADPITIY